MHTAEDVEIGADVTVRGAVEFHWGVSEFPGTAPGL
jgi:hypothetical protein